MWAAPSLLIDFDLHELVDSYPVLVCIRYLPIKLASVHTKDKKLSFISYLFFTHILRVQWVFSEGFETYASFILDISPTIATLIRVAATGICTVQLFVAVIFN